MTYAIWIKRIGALAVALLMGMTISSGTANAASSYRFALLLSTTNNPYFAAMKEAAEEKAESLGVQLQVLDARNNSTTQLNQIQALLAKQVDLLLVNPTNADTITPAIKQANEAGVPVILLDRKTNGGQALAFFASDNVAAGRIACQFIADKLDGGGTMAILLGIPGASATNERTEGCMNVLAEYPDIEVVAKQTAHFDRAEGLNVMQNMLTANPEGIDAVFAENDEMALGAVSALKAAHALDQTLVVSIDGTPEGIEAVKNGAIALSVGQQPGLMATMGVAAGYHYLESQTLFVPVPLVRHTAQ